jgi:outer membrane receptor protein involved in Fe transport
MRGWELMTRKVVALLVGALMILTQMTGSIAAAAETNPRPSRSLSGTVEDSLGRPIKGAKVTLKGANGRALKRGVTDSHGHFSFAAVAPGTYELDAHHGGFKPGIAIVTVGGSSAKPITIALAAEQALSLAVVAKRLNYARNGLSPETGGSVYRFSEQAVKELPQGANSSMSSVLLQAPGVAQDSNGGLHIRGEHADIQYRLNGIEIPEGITSGFSETFSPRFARSISLLEGALPAQYGYQTAGVVEIQTKSGASLQGGDLEMYGGQRGTLQPNFEVGGTKGKLDYYATGYYLQNNRGLAPPTPGPEAIHDDTNQGNGFGYLSYFLSPTTRLAAFGGFNVSHFQIPANPDQSPAFMLSGISDYPSAGLQETQFEQNYYGVVALQGVLPNNIDYQISAFSRYSTLSFHPDPAGDLIYNGIASRVFRGDSASGSEGDFTWRGWAHHTVRAGYYFTGERAEIDNHAQVFPGGPGFQTSDVPINVVDNGAEVAWLYGVYLQDEWRPLPKLTINYGVRFDLYDGITRSDQASPRVAVVYQLFERTALHAAYARYFTPPPLEAVSGEDIGKFAGTTNEPAVTRDSTISPERAHYFDVGATQNLPHGLKLNLDSYYKKSSDLIDEGQFGPTVIYTPFNYDKGRQYGVELTTSLNLKKLTAYVNFAYSVAQGTNIVSDQFLFDPAELDYIKTHYVFLDHDQTYTASWGAAYHLYGFLLTLDGNYASGLRTGFANTGNQPFYVQFNAGIVKSLTIPRVGRFDTRLVAVNLGDWIYQLRSGSGIGVFAPQYGPRRAVYAGVKWYFPWSASAATQ